MTDLIKPKTLPLLGKEQCGNCKMASVMATTNGTDDLICRLNPPETHIFVLWHEKTSGAPVAPGTKLLPNAELVPVPHIHASHVAVQPDAWCGQWKPKIMLAK